MNSKEMKDKMVDELWKHRTSRCETNTITTVRRNQIDKLYPERNQEMDNVLSRIELVLRDRLIHELSHDIPKGVSAYEYLLSSGLMFAVLLPTVTKDEFDIIDKRYNTYRKTAGYAVTEDCLWAFQETFCLKPIIGVTGSTLVWCASEIVYYRNPFSDEFDEESWVKMDTQLGSLEQYETLLDALVGGNISHYHICGNMELLDDMYPPPDPTDYT